MSASRFNKFPHADIEVDAGTTVGPFEWWRHCFGHGAINNSPLPPRVVDGVKKVKPRLIRVFLQEYFRVYPDHGVYDWSILDPYMDALAETGADVLATINLKPKVLFPEIDETVWRPNNLSEWQDVIYQLVKRYSVDRQIVTHWEHANEPDMGELGACPYLIPTAEENFEFYRTMIEPILAAFPDAKVGGPAMAYHARPTLKGFIELCARNDTQLDFVSWHRYDSNLDAFREGVKLVQGYLEDYYPGKRPEMMLNEWNYGFDFSDLQRDTYDATTVEEMAMDAQRAAFTAANILSLMETGLDWSHHFLIWDNCCYPEQFRPFFSEESLRGVMYKHWNEMPARFGLFSEGQVVRPQYFVFQMLSRMGDEQIAVKCPDPDVHVQAATSGNKLSVLAANYNMRSTRDIVLTVKYGHLKPGTKTLTAYRIDAENHWSTEAMELTPIEQRTVAVLPEYAYQFYLPADSVLLVTLEGAE